MFKEDSASLPARVHSPVNLPRRAHPGAVLLSPTASGMASSHSTGTATGAISHLPLSPQLSSQHMSLNDLLDQQQNMLLDSQRTAAAGTAVVSPLMQPSSSLYLDSFTRPPSSVAPAPAPAPPRASVVINFANDLNQLCSWMLMLSTSQQNSVMDNLLSSLSEEVLHHTKLKLDSLISSGYIPPSVMSPQIASPVPNRDVTPQPLTLDSLLNNNMSTSMGTSMGASMNRQWSPAPQASATTSQPIYDYINDLAQRPHSADTQQRKKFTSPGKVTPKKSQAPVKPTATYGNGFSSVMDNGNSSFTSVSPNGENLSPTSSCSSSMNPKVLTDPKLLTNIPAWLKSLRLHKYSDALGGKPWFELVYLEDEDLEKMGVLALGARRKLIKAFAVVRGYKERGLIERSAY
ncbi:LAMI_0F05380g1_1 [Lachancea mirantina]|uniref:RNA-binding protein VTS1 n=1 Tax=Lachancea mirantina TaxID=1230905 RepID=A0A1G4JYC8_9SACH|nr:LAMI_0F05380g1_1 [Lachancea mirantina]